MEIKQTNPKDALGIKKAPLHCIPCGPLYELGLAMMEGGRKYGTHNYRAVGTRASVYYDAAMRHLTNWWEGEDIDSDSGLHPLIKVAACCVVMRDSMLMGNDVDDRPIKYPNGLDMNKLNEQAAKLIGKITKCVAPFLEKDKPFVCPAGWKIALNRADDCGWYACYQNYNLHQDAYLHKGGTLHTDGGTGKESYYKFGEAPGYWPTKKDAEAALVTYLGKKGS
ncbi:hypothetical protein LCGC14_0979860 [marine sediment metagenome]|uniref:dATP/dGTP diphosphohydrolase N-terminal domain-containing protein n=1 Tax=marine sediment metagenome TaxID=412755 RepID=A0A0F9NDH2_9ZZZZ